jgi:nitrite reductase (NADH) small subunit
MEIDYGISAASGSKRCSVDWLIAGISLAVLTRRQLMKTGIAELSEIFAPPASINLGPVERIPVGEGREFEVEGELIAVFRARDGGVFCMQARCPHRDGHLADGVIGAGLVVCPLHTFKFDLATGKPVGNDCDALKTYRVTLNEEGEIVLWL